MINEDVGFIAVRGLEFGGLEWCGSLGFGFAGVQGFRV